MNKGILVGLAASTVLVAGCANIGYLPDTFVHSHNSSSLVDFLYPDGHVPAASAERPQLAIPLRVGLAFLPSANAQGAGLDEAHKEALLERIKQRFARRRFVSEIVLLPDYYLAGHRGFAGLDGIKRLYGLDVIALVSFDQETHLDQNEWSLAYLTIVGAYVVKGNRHDVSTLIDLAVVDPESRQLVIRAGGTDLRHGNTTLIDAGRQTREANVAGFSAATDQMIDHFDAALTKFEADVRSGTAPIRVVSKNAGGSGGGGGGAIDAVCIAALLVALAQRAAAQR
ncbi:MAG TPA: rhombotarget lipoprotein [Steroidobacteraceae bacterium]|nr:rhombotarget lipoprotein [Steroidobacteraceae bacterium]